MSIYQSKQHLHIIQFNSCLQTRRNFVNKMYYKYPGCNISVIVTAHKSSGHTINPTHPSLEHIARSSKFLQVQSNTVYTERESSQTVTIYIRNVCPVRQLQSICGQSHVHCTWLHPGFCSAQGLQNFSTCQQTRNILNKIYYNYSNKQRNPFKRIEPTVPGTLRLRLI